jgi:hypothetical protein
MKKNISQDVIPPTKTIRNVELLYKSKRPERRGTPKPPKQAEITPPPTTPESFAYKYEYDEPVKRSKKFLYISVGFLILTLFFVISALFKSAKIEITPKNQISSVNEKLQAFKDTSTGGLEFQVVSTTKDVEKKIVATEEERVEKKATGTIVVYNNFSTQSQTLVKTTRFATPEGLIYRATTNITVPGIQIKNGKSVAGSVEVLVEADKPGTTYNIPLKDFTVVGFKGTSKYTKIYGRSKTEMAGGFSGIQKTVSKETMDMVDKELETLLKQSLMKDIASQIPENFVLYEKTISYNIGKTIQMDSIGDVSQKTDTAVLKKKGSVQAIIFDKGSLSREIIAKVLPNSTDSIIKITNLGDLNFTFTPENSFNPDASSSVGFTLTGDANLVWVFDENKLKTDLLGMSKKNALAIISKDDTIHTVNLEFHPFWIRTIPQDPEKVTLINTLAK